MKHTPGPWILLDDGKTIIEGCEPANSFPFEIAKVVDDSNTDRANARLIAAAPEMLTALKSVVAFWDRLSFDGSAINEIHEEARAAIAKAVKE